MDLKKTGVRILCIVMACLMLSGVLVLFFPGQAYAANTITLITREKAVEAAQQKVTGTVLSLELEGEDGKAVYSVSIMDSSGYRNDLDIDAQTGEVVRTYKKSQKKVYSYQSYKNPKIAWTTALETAKESIPDSKVWSFEMDRGWDKAVYEVDVTDSSGVPYTVRVDSVTGEINSSKRSGDVPQSAAPAIAPAKAEQAALNAIGGGQILYCGLDYDDGVLYFEVRAVSNQGVVYDFEIDAGTGAVLEQERDD